MALTDLTGTKWLLNTFITEYVEGIDLEEAPLAAFLVYTSVKDSQVTYWADINFISNGQNFIAIGGEDSIPLDAGDYTEVYSGEWYDEAYRTIEITGGSDATNTDLIAWLQYNATQIVEETVLPSFTDVEVTPHEGYITMTINGVDFNLKTAASGYTVTVSYTNGTIGFIACADDEWGTNKVTIAQPNTASYTFTVPQNKTYILVQNAGLNNSAVNYISGGTFITGFRVWDAPTPSLYGAVIQITADNANISLRTTGFE